MIVLDVARRHRRAQQTITRKTADHVQTAWRDLNQNDLTGSWTASVGGRVTAAVAAGQYLSAAIAQPYVTAALHAQDVPTDPTGEVDGSAFTGSASDGRDLTGLLYLPVIAVKQYIAAGRAAPDAMAAGGSLLLSYAATQVADAGRAATSVARTAEPHAHGYIRVLTPPSCPRCAILGGRWYRWDAAFPRHTSCDCTEVPAGRESAAASMLTDPTAAVKAGHVTGLSQAERQAVDDGADLAQVVNAHRGMYTAAGRGFTRDGTARGTFPGGRLTPEQIYADADGDRTAALRLLTSHGYLLH